MILVSACLLGYNCKYSGSSNRRQGLIEHREKCIPVCPEVMGGLPTPRPAAQFDRGDGGDVLGGKARIFDKTGKDVTENFIRGAYKALEIARQNYVKKAVLKECSPSCGINKVYITEKGDSPVPGKGVTAALLEKNNILLYSDENYPEFILYEE